jgi:hypothetical protein
MEQSIRVQLPPKPFAFPKERPADGGGNVSFRVCNNNAITEECLREEAEKQLRIMRINAVLKGKSRG